MAALDGDDGPTAPLSSRPRLQPLAVARTRRDGMSIERCSRRKGRSTAFSREPRGSAWPRTRPHRRPLRRPCSIRRTGLPGAPRDTASRPAETAPGDARQRRCRLPTTGGDARRSVRDCHDGRWDGALDAIRTAKTWSPRPELDAAAAAEAKHGAEVDAQSRLMPESRQACRPPSTSCARAPRPSRPSDVDAAAISRGLVLRWGPTLMRRHRLVEGSDRAGFAVRARRWYRLSAGRSKRPSTPTPRPWARPRPRLDPDDPPQGDPA